VNSSDELDSEVRAVGELLTRVLGRVPEDVAFLTAGAWSRAFAFRDRGAEFVVRLSSLDEDFHKDRLASRYRSAALPIPRFIEMGSTDTGFYAITERVMGSYFEAADEATMRPRLGSFFAALDAIRLADVEHTTGFGVWNAREQAPHATWRDALLSVAIDHPGRRHHGWRNLLAASTVGIGPFDAAFAQLRSVSADLPETRHLVHSDLVNGNVLAVGKRLTGVLDWGSSMYGDFVHDVAWISFWAPWYPHWGNIDFAAEARRHYAEIGLDVPGFDDRLRACQIHIGLEGQAYMARFGLTADLERTAQRTLEIAMGRQRP
jgi:hygromycin-B 4-O-kinase